ncbi:LL-diaminopimelate aminotransferase [Bacillus sp. 1P06AnD]|uniref:LL-diaminopimelate aminotransferase n=1 Tax=Bacillus sp. 1P06AnD TaxID=3132208 RepID=UPI0039A352CB
MNIKQADRMDSFSSSVFSELSRIIGEKRKKGEKIYDFSIGSPDIAPPSFIKETISTLALDDSQYRYSLTGIQPFNNAVSSYYKNRYNVTLNPANEVIQLMGSQDGLVHLPMALVNPGEYVLVPDPGYTAYATGISMAGGVPYYMPLLKENSFLPDFSRIPSEIAQKASLMFLNFPGNPIPVTATKELFEEAIHFAQKYNIIIVHDFAYSEFYYGEEKPLSFLSVPGSKDVGIEMNSLSKSFSLAGCRIAYAIGHPGIIQALTDLKSNLDYGVFLPTQYGAIQALGKGEAFTANTRRLYKRRKDLLVSGLQKMGWNVEHSEAGMFVWAEIPNGQPSMEFTFDLLAHANIAVTPGVAFGPSGEGYVRIALVQPEDIIAEALLQLERYTEDCQAK